MKYILKEKGVVVVKNVDHGKCCCDEVKSNATEKTLCPIYNEQRRRGIIVKDEIELYFCTNKDIDSSKLWKKSAQMLIEFLDTYKEIRNELTKEFIKTTDRLTHNLKKYNAHCVQAAENILDPYSTSSGTRGQIETIKQTISQDLIKSSQSFLRIIKNNKLIQAELSVYDRLYKTSKGGLQKISHSIHRLLRATLSAFWQSFLETNITIELQNCYEEIFVDYETITVAFVHLIDNCTKYVLPYSTINITIERQGYNRLKVSFRMLSLSIREHEKELIFNEGYSGELACEKSLNGSGIGMYIIKYFIELNDGTIEIRNNTNPSKNMTYDGIDYQENIIEVVLPLSNAIRST